MNLVFDFFRRALFVGIFFLSDFRRFEQPFLSSQPQQSDVPILQPAVRALHHTARGRYWRRLLLDRRSHLHAGSSAL